MLSPKMNSMLGQKMREGRGCRENIILLFTECMTVFVHEASLN